MAPLGGDLGFGQVRRGAELDAWPETAVQKPAPYSNRICFYEFAANLPQSCEFTILFGWYNLI